MKSLNISSGSLSFNEENLLTGIFQKRIVIGLVDSTSFEGAYEKVPYHFKHFDLQYCSLMVDRKMVPQKRLMTNFTKGNTPRSYLNLLE